MRLSRPRKPHRLRARRGHSAPPPAPAAATASDAPPAPVDAPSDPADDPALEAERRVRSAGGPEDQATYACRCGAVFPAAPTTSVSCPLCGVHQAW